MNRFFEGIVDFLEKNGGAEKEYRDVYLYAVQTVAVYLFNICSGLAIGGGNRLLYIFSGCIYSAAPGGRRIPCQGMEELLCTFMRSTGSDIVLD